MTTHPSLPDLFGRATLVLGGNDDLRHDAESLRRLCLDLRAENPLPLGTIRRQVDSFLDRLIAHFEAEESPDYFGTLEAESFSFELAIARLVTEHREMMERIARLREFDSPSRKSIEFSLQLEALLDLLASHERSESAMIRQFLAPETEY